LSLFPTSVVQVQVLFDSILVARFRCRDTHNEQALKKNIANKDECRRQLLKNLVDLLLDAQRMFDLENIARKFFIGEEFRAHTHTHTHTHCSEPV
jgi:F0F1-type ATP synthase delta subunit